MSSLFKFSCCSQTIASFENSWWSVQKPNILRVKINRMGISFGLCFIPDFALWLSTYWTVLSQIFDLFGAKNFLSEICRWQYFNSHEDLEFAVSFLHVDIYKGCVQLVTLFTYCSERMESFFATLGFTVRMISNRNSSFRNYLDPLLTGDIQEQQYTLSQTGQPLLRWEEPGDTMSAVWLIPVVMIAFSCVYKKTWFWVLSCLYH